MKALFLVFGLISSLTSLLASDCAPRHVISDFDDTIKTYTFDNHFSRLGHMLLGKRINPGMKEVIQAVSKKCHPGAKASILTASPRFFGPSIRRLLEAHQFGSYELTMRPLREKTYDYKVNRVTRIQKNIDKPVILIGDDTSQDANAYFTFADKNEENHLATYIHNVRNTRNLKGQIKYTTSYEIALHEYSQNRIEKADVIAVAIQNLMARSYLLIPRYAHCPTEYSLPQTDELDIDTLSAQLRNKVEDICQNR